MNNKFFLPTFDDDGRVQAVHLTRPVTINGRDFFGRRAWLHFVPSYDYSPGWYYDRQGPCERFWNMNPSNFVSKRRRLCLVDNEGGVLINYPEHIMSLRLLGLDAVGISCGPGTWPPYLLTGEIWEKLSPNLKLAGYTLDWHKLSSSPETGCCPDTSRITRARGLKDEQGININAHIDFGQDGGPVENEEFFFGPGMYMEDLKNIFYSPTPGWPPKLYHFVKLASMFGWPHNKRVCWQKDWSDEFTGIVWARHRILDILGAVGAMSCMFDDVIISVDIISIKGGHQSDLRALKAHFTQF